MCPDILPHFLIRYPMIKQKSSILYGLYHTSLCLVHIHLELYMPDNFSYLGIYSHNYAPFTYILTQRPFCGSGN